MQDFLANRMQTSQEPAYKRTETQWSVRAAHLKCSSNVVLDQNALKVKRFTAAKETTMSSSQPRPSVLRSPAAKWFRNSADLDADTPRRRAPEHRDGLNTQAISGHRHGQEIQRIPDRTKTATLPSGHFSAVSPGCQA